MGTGAKEEVGTILGVYRGYRPGFEHDELVASLRRLREKEPAKDAGVKAIEETHFMRLLKDIESLIDGRKKKEALMALVAARMRLNDLKTSARMRDRMEMELVRLRAEIDAI